MAISTGTGTVLLLKPATTSSSVDRITPSTGAARSPWPSARTARWLATANSGDSTGTIRLWNGPTGIAGGPTSAWYFRCP